VFFGKKSLVMIARIDNRKGKQDDNIEQHNLSGSPLALWHDPGQMPCLFIKRVLLGLQEAREVLQVYREGVTHDDQEGEQGEDDGHDQESEHLINTTLRFEIINL